MYITNEELIAVLSSFNPWWRNESIPDLPTWQRSAFLELFTWAYSPPAPRAILLSGARQVGKTILLMQTIRALLEKGVPPSNILYVTFDHPLIKMAGTDAVLAAWRELEPKKAGVEYLFLDEAQFIRNWGTWVKHQMDFTKERRIIYTGSATPLIKMDPESGVGRTHIIKLATLSFYEYLQLKRVEFIKNIESFKKFLKENKESDHLSEILMKEAENKLLPNVPKIQKIEALEDLFNLSAQEIYKIAELARPYSGNFHEYLLRGGFPQTCLINSLSDAQRLLREDIIDKVLKRDMTAVFGVRHILDLEQLFLYLCMHNSGILDMAMLCRTLGIKRPTVQNFIELLEATHLIYKLLPFGYGKDILRGKYKIYLADAAIAPAVLLKGKEIIKNTEALGVLTETVVFKHLYSYYQIKGARLTYWQNEKNKEVDIVVEKGDGIVPFEVKYRSQHTKISDIVGLLDLCRKKEIKQAFVITKALDDFGLLQTDLPNTQIMRVPAALFCYWLGEMEKSR